MRTVLALLVALPLSALAEPGAVPPRPGHYVTDGAGVLDPARAAALDARLAEFERTTSNQVLVWIARRVPEGTTMEELGAEAIRAWGVGQKGKDNGVVLFVFTEQKRTRIATGYGLEGAIPDIAAKRILVDLVRPHVLRGDFDQAVEAGADAILQLAAAEGNAGTGRTVAETGPPWLGAAGWALVVLILVLAALRRSLLILGIGAAAGVAGVVGLYRDFTPISVGMQAIILALMAPVALIGGVVQAFGGNGRRRGPGGSSDWSPVSESSSSSSDGSYGSGDSSSSSSSDFDGGGGDSGGGGASDD
jgi:uncharacterized protein